MSGEYTFPSPEGRHLQWVALKTVNVIPQDAGGGEMVRKSLRYFPSWSQRQPFENIEYVCACGYLGN